MGTREDMIAQSERCLGTVEHPPGSNNNFITDWYGLDDAWCDMTMTWAAWHSGNSSCVCGGGKYAYTVAHANFFRSRGSYHVGTAGIQRGDIVFFNWHDGGDSIDHVGICTGTSGSAVLTIEGNIENACKRKVRYSDVIAGYGRPAYVGAAPSPSPGPPASPGTVTFPGESWFRTEPYSPLITSMGKRLVAVGCSAYSDGPGPQWTDADKDSYARWQRRCGFSGPDANGWPGKTSWDKLRVPR